MDAGARSMGAANACQSPAAVAAARSRRESAGAMQSPVELIELEPARLPMPPRQSRAPPPPPPPTPTPTPSASQRSADESSLLSSSRALYSSPMRPSQYVPRPPAPEEDAAAAAEREAERKRQLERVSLEQALLRRRWQVHSVSALFHFRREMLSAYAHDLVKSLRATAQRASGQQFGYSVSIRNASAASVVFLVREDRRASSAARRRASLSASRPPDAAAAADAASASTSAPTEERAAAFVLYVPGELERRKPRKGREEQQVLLLRGNEELLAWSCSWLQRSFQCVVDAQPARVSELNLRRLARNLAVSSLLEQRAERAAAARPSQEQTPGEQASLGTKAAEEPKTARAPLVLQFRNPDARAPMQTYTLTVPWEALRRVYDQASSGENSSPNGAVPGASCAGSMPPRRRWRRVLMRRGGDLAEIIEMVERAYFDALPFDLSTFSLARFEMEEVAMTQAGDVEVSAWAVHRRLHGALTLVRVTRAVLQPVARAQRALQPVRPAGHPGRTWRPAASGCHLLRRFRRYRAHVGSRRPPSSSPPSAHLLRSDNQERLIPAGVQLDTARTRVRGRPTRCDGRVLTREPGTRTTCKRHKQAACSKTNPVGGRRTRPRST